MLVIKKYFIHDVFSYSLVEIVEITRVGCERLDGLEVGVLLG